jgi:hypothetical protein
MKSEYQEINLLFLDSTERRGSLFNTSLSYSGEVGLKYRPGDRLS